MSKDRLLDWLRWQYMGRSEYGAEQYYERDWIQIVLVLLMIALSVAAVVIVARMFLEI